MTIPPQKYVCVLFLFLCCFFLIFDSHSWSCLASFVCSALASIPPHVQHGSVLCSVLPDIHIYILYNSNKKKLYSNDTYSCDVNTTYLSVSAINKFRRYNNALYRCQNSHLQVIFSDSSFIRKIHFYFYEILIYIYIITTFKYTC